MLPGWFSGHALRRWASRDLDEGMIMKPYHQRLVLECVVLAVELVRFANKVIALLNVTFNYSASRDPELAVTLRA